MKTNSLVTAGAALCIAIFGSVPGVTQAATATQYVKVYFDASGNIVGSRGLDCANGDGVGGVTSAYVVTNQQACKLGAPSGPVSTSALPPPGFTQTDLCTLIENEGLHGCGEPPFFVWPPA